MIMDKGTLSNADEKWLARFLDNLKKFKNPILEIGDYYFYRCLIKILDDVLYEKYVPDNWKNPITDLIRMAKAMDVDGIGELVISRANENIDIPFIDEPTEAATFRSAYGLLTAKIHEGLVWMQSKGVVVEGDEQN